jgi:hypothetical protein
MRGNYMRSNYSNSSNIRDSYKCCISNSNRTTNSFKSSSNNSYNSNNMRGSYYSSSSMHDSHSVRNSYSRILSSMHNQLLPTRTNRSVVA